MGALTFYILSIGPAAKVHREVENPAVRGAIETVYAPVVWLVNVSDTSQSAVLWYVSLWVGGSD